MRSSNNLYPPKPSQCPIHLFIKHKAIPAKYGPVDISTPCFLILNVKKIKGAKGRLQTELRTKVVIWVLYTTPFSLIHANILFVTFILFVTGLLFAPGTYIYGTMNKYCRTPYWSKLPTIYIHLYGDANIFCMYYYMKKHLYSVSLTY